MIVCGSLLVILSLVPRSEGASIYIDAINGIDGAGKGDTQNPLKTLPYAWLRVAGGDHVFLRSGKYQMPAGLGAGPKSIFASLVTVSGEVGAVAVIANQLTLGADGGQYYGPRYGGTFDANLAFENLHFADGVDIYGAVKVSFTKCKVEKVGPWTGSVTNIMKTAFYIMGGRDLRIEGCEITNAGNGITIAAVDSIVARNYIHYLTQDGIEVVGSQNLLIEGNKIENLDDGIEDGDADWNRHCDGIQLWMMFDKESSTNENIVIRGNQIFNTEQGMQFNNFQNKSFHNHRITVENNVFGPARGPAVNNAEPTDDLTFRNNSVVLTSQDPSFQSRFRTIKTSNFSTAFNGFSTGLEIYNNILVGLPVRNQNAIRTDHNLYIARDNVQFGNGPLARGCMRSLINPYISPLLLDGKLRPDSIAVNAGTRLNAQGQGNSSAPEADFYGTVRDNRPDIGAFEFPALHPAPEKPVALYNDEKLKFVDDFVDGNLNRDPFLEAPRQAGIEWSHSNVNENSTLTNYNVQYDQDLANNWLSEPMETGNFLVTAANVGKLRSFSFTFDMRATDSADGGGPVFCWSDPENFLWLRIGINGTFLYEMRAGVLRQITALPGFIVNRNTTYRYKIKFDSLSALLNITRPDGKSYSSRVDVPRRNQYTTEGNLGFYRHSEIRYHRNVYGNVLIEKLN